MGNTPHERGTMGLHTEIDKIANQNPDGDPRDLAATLLSRLKRADLIGLLAEEIAHAQRSLVRSVERDTFRQAFTATTRAQKQSPATTDEAFRALFDCTFKIGDGSQATWAEATEEQHLARIAMLEKLRAGLDATIDRHREAVRLIRSHGVACLAQIPAEDKAAA